LKYKGRIVTFFIVLLINSIYITYYYIRDGFISWMEYIGLPILLTLAWWFGKQYDKAKFYSEKDTLTGIYNRRFIEDFFPKIKAIAERNDQKFAVLLVDVNNFKTINDNLGHKEGDELLKVLSNQLEKSIRNTDIVARWGGDEFIILSPDSKKKEEVEEIVGRIHNNLKVISTTDLEISVSVGTAIYPSEGTTLDDLLRVADKKMYNMKIRNKAK
jgi:diguanylate cyclase (GGDEF)-like protein